MVVSQISLFLVLLFLQFLNLMLCVITQCCSDDQSISWCPWRKTGNCATSRDFKLYSLNMRSNLCYLCKFILLMVDWSIEISVIHSPHLWSVFNVFLKLMYIKRKDCTESLRSRLQYQWFTFSLKNSDTKIGCRITHDLSCLLMIESNLIQGFLFVYPVMRLTFLYTRIC